MSSCRSPSVTKESGGALEAPESPQLSYIPHSPNKQYTHEHRYAQFVCRNMHATTDSHSVRIPQFSAPTPTSNWRASQTAAAFERELKAQLDPQRLTAPIQQTAASLIHPFVFLLTASSSDKCEKETGVRVGVCVCLCSSLSTCVNNIWRAPTVEKRDVHSLFNNKCRLWPG